MTFSFDDREFMWGADTPTPSKALKYSPDQPRDENGQWTDGGGGRDAKIAEGMATLERHQRESRDERLMVFDAKTGELLHDMTGDGSRVDSYYIAPEGVSTVDVHTHPKGDTAAFSDGDWKRFSWSHIEEMRVIAADHIFTLKKTEKWEQGDWKQRTPAALYQRWNDIIDGLTAEPGWETFDVILTTNRQMAEEFGAEFTMTPRAKPTGKALKYSEDQPRDAQGQWTDGGGSEISNAAPARTFTSDEGYQWHESDERKAWAASLTEADVRVIGDYASFSYTEINQVARGDVLMKVEEVRSPTPEEFTAWREAQYDWSKVDPPADVPGGRFTGGPFGKVVRDVVDTERMEQVGAQVAQLNQAFDERGYVLDEDITVGRAAYYPGVHFTEVHKWEGAERTEGGFTSTMVGEAGGRLEMYIANGKAESIYRRHGKIEGIAEIGTAIKFNIRVPAGSKVLPVEAVRQRGGRDRTESELMLRSGARYRVTSVEPGGLSKWVNFSTSYLTVNMEYLGDGGNQ